MDSSRKKCGGTYKGHPEAGIYLGGERNKTKGDVGSKDARAVWGDLSVAAMRSKHCEGGKTVGVISVVHRAPGGNGDRAPKGGGIP